MKLLACLLVLAHVAPLVGEGAHGASPGNPNQTMFHEEFFPTPPEVIARMMRPWAMQHDANKLDLTDLRVLDPSAGSGSLLKYIHEHSYTGRAPACCHAVEVNPACRTLLEAEPYISVVGHDFLEFEPTTPYDLVVMNPPFSNGHKHVLHAWDLITTGNLVCLLNAETVRNPHSAGRKQLVKLIEEHGSVEFIGPAFAKAERPTDVEVALVRLSKIDERDRFGFWNDAYFQRERRQVEFDEDTLGNAVAVNDLTVALVSQYRQVEGIFVDYLKSYRRLRFHVQAMLAGTHRSFDDMLRDAVRFHDKPQEMLDRFMDELRQHAWDSIITRTRLHDLMTESVRRDFDQLQQGQRGMDFTEENIHALFRLLWENQYKILQRSVEESFDLMTRYHKENRVHVEGWLSNDAFKVAPKVVLPGAVRLGYVGGMEVCQYGGKKLDDIDRGIAMVSGARLSSITSVEQALRKRFSGMRVHSGALEENTCQSTYFHIRFFKKGTIHLTWRDEALRERFNLAAAQCKKWLPMDYGRKPGAATRNEPSAERAAQLLLNA